LESAEIHDEGKTRRGVRRNPDRRVYGEGIENLSISSDSPQIGKGWTGSNAGAKPYNALCGALFAA
jgi:hypothetical protein